MSVGCVRGRMLGKARVRLGEPADGKGGVEAADIVRGGAEEDLGVAGLVAEFGEGGVAGGKAGGDQLLMRESALGRGQRGDGGFRDAHLRIEGGEAHEGGAHQQADGGDQRDEQKTAENQSLVETQHVRDGRRIPES